MPALNIIFMGTPDFSVPALAALHEAGHNILCVYTQPPRPAGRGHNVKKSAIHEWADAHDIAVHTPKSLKNKEEQDIFAQYNADLAVVAAYGLILPQEVLDAPRHGCINIHASILPRWRGASPIQRAIWAQDSESGVTIMQMDTGLDTGDMLLIGKTPILADTTAQSLHDELSRIGGDLMVIAANVLASGEALTPEKQDDEQSCYARLLKKEDGQIDWTQSADQIDAQIRALNPWPGTFTQIQDESGKQKRMKITAAALPNEQSTAEEAGTILNKDGDIACGSDGSILRISRIQPDGKKPMDFASALNGGYIHIGQKFDF